MKRILLFLLIILPWLGLGQSTMLHWYLPKLSLDKVQNLSQYDGIIVDPDVIYNDRESLDQLRKLNPDIIIMSYFNPAEFFDPMFDDKPWGLKIAGILKDKEAWWLKDSQGQRVGLWPGMYTLDCSLDCPKYYVDGAMKNYITFITDRFIADVLEQYPFDGVLIDNVWDSIGWIGNHVRSQAGLDRDNDGLKDDKAAIDGSWYQGMESCLKKLRHYDPGLTLICNPASLSYSKSCDGKMFEHFPDKYVDETDSCSEAWYANMNVAFTMAQSHDWGFNILNAREDNYFFTLASAMLLDQAFFSYKQNTPYEKRWELGLGKAKGEAKSLENGNMFRRQYENGAVYVAPLQKKAWIEYLNGQRRDN